jgi:hypothetical protein
MIQDNHSDESDAISRGGGRMRTLTPRIAACVVAALALLAGAIPAVAATLAARPTTINACVTGKTGAIKIVSASAKCKTGQHKISWSSRGPRGPQGPPAVVAGYLSSLGQSIGLTTTFTTVNSLALPAGSFLVTAMVPMRTESLGTVTCRLADSKGIISEASDTVTPDSDGIGEGDITLTGATTSGGTISVLCLEAQSTAAALAFGRVMTATPVKKITS